MQIALISCVSKKLPHRAKACDLYTSTLFRLNYQYAMCRNVDRIAILSAKYHLLNPNTIIDPYDETLNTMRMAARRSWAEEVLVQMDDAFQLQGDHFIILAGAKYREYLTPRLVSFEVPLQSLPIGKQLQYLKSQIAELCPQQTASAKNYTGR